jgi:hypothetical protein
VTEIAFHKCIQTAIAGLANYNMPAWRKAKRVVTIADIPEAKSRVPAAPSRPAITLAAASTVGLAQRVYK